MIARQSSPSPSNPRTIHRPLARLALVVLAAGSLAAVATAQEPAETFEGEAAVTVVEIPVQVVLRDGEPVRGVSKANFRLFDGRDEVTITSFEAIDLARVEARGPEAMRAVEPAARRHFLLLFDLSFSSPGQVVEAQRAARQLLDGGLHPTDLVGVAFYTSRQGLSMPLGFTTDRDQVRRVLDGFGLLLGEDVDLAAYESEQDDEPKGDPLQLTAGSFVNVLSQIGASAGVKISDAQVAALAASGSSGGPSSGRGAGIDGGALLLETLRDIDRSQTNFIKQERGSEVRAMLGNYQALIEQLADVEGKKYLVLFTGGFPSRLMGVGEFGMPEEGASQTLSAMDELADAFGRAGWVIHTVEPRGARAQYWEESGAQSLTYLASETDGLSFQNFNDLSGAMGQMLDSTSVTYLLTFQTAQLPTDGSFRPIRVRLENVPRGAKAIHRSGYYAPEPLSDKTALEQRTLTAAMILADEPWESLPVAVRAVPLPRPGGGKVPVPVMVELGGSGILGSAGGSTPAGAVGVEIFSYAFDGEGRIQGFLSQALGLDLAQHRETLAGGGLKFFGDFELAPGSYEIRTLVRTPSNSLSSLVVTPLQVEAAAAGEEPTLLAPVFLQGADERWLLTREAGAEGSYPFVLDGQTYVPAVRPVLPPDGEATVILLGHRLGAGQMALESRVTAASGQAIQGGEISFVTRAEAAGPAPDQIVTTFRPAGLAPGAYTLVLTLVDKESGRREIASAPFQVGS